MKSRKEAGKPATVQDQVEDMIQELVLPALKEVLEDNLADSKIKMTAISALLSLRRQTKPEDDTGIDAAELGRILTGGLKK